MRGCSKEWRQGRGCVGRQRGGEVRRVVGMYGTNQKSVDVDNARQKIAVRIIKKSYDQSLT